MISVRNLSKSYAQHVALAPTTYDFRESQTTVLIGPSGCGKSTLLRLMLGLIPATTGSILLNNEEIFQADFNKIRHRIGYVIQDGGLFPHLTNERNVTLLARYLRRPKDEISNRVQVLADLVRLPEELLSRFPSDISGGQRQRVGLMRALMLDPDLLLLDEPLGALDPIIRNQLQTDLRSIFNRLNKTVILVTHDMGEAAYLGDVIMLLRDGHIIQSGTLSEFLHNPADQFVQQFIEAQRPLQSFDAPNVKAITE